MLVVGVVVMLAIVTVTVRAVMVMVVSGLGRDAGRKLLQPRAEGLDALAGLRADAHHRGVVVDLPDVRLEAVDVELEVLEQVDLCLLYTSPSPRD